jgi:peroxiredoxin family protein
MTAAAADSSRLDRLEREIAALREGGAEPRVSLVVFSGELDRHLAALVIATGAAAMGMSVSIFYTFWGLSALKKKRILKGKDARERMFSLMTPKGVSGMPVSRMNFGGIGRAMLKSMMARKQVSSVEDLFALARDMGVKFIACTMSMDVMGITAEELVDGVALGGVATFLGDASRSKVSLFI